MPLIGRRGEIGAVLRLLDRAMTGTGGHLIVTGPAGSGKSALVDSAVAVARDRELPVFRAAGTCVDSGDVWEQLATDLGAEHNDLAAVALGGPRLLVVDDVDRAGPHAMDVLKQLASRLGSGSTALIVTAQAPLEMSSELRLKGLSESELAGVLPGLPDDAVHAVWLRSGGLPGAAIDLAAELSGLDATADAVVHLALAAPSKAGFLDLDAGLIRLLESTAKRPLDPTLRARVLARLARELLADPSSATCRRELVDEAVALARLTGIPGTIAEVLDSSLHALWDPAAAQERLSTASEIVETARRAGDAALERRGLFWRFVARAELADLDAAEAALAAYARAGELAGDAAAAVVVLARQAMLATIRGRFDTATELAAELGARGRRAGLTDTDRLSSTLLGYIAMLRGEFTTQAESLQALARRLPGHFFEATAARMLAESGNDVEAGLELERLLPAVLAGSGPRWLGAVADLAVVASRTGQPPAVEAIYTTLLPYQGRLVVWGGANTITGPVDDYLGRLAARLGRDDAALSHLDAAVELENRIGALPWLATTLVSRAAVLSSLEQNRADDDLARARSIAERLGMNGLLTSLTPPRDEWRLARDGESWLLEAGAESARVRDGRGMQYLRLLLAAPGQEIAALDLVAGGAGIRVSDGDPVLDTTARHAYRRRLEALDEQLDAADRAGDVDRATSVNAERSALLAELRRATGLGGRQRALPGEAERARVNATRALWAAVSRLEAAAPLTGAHLRASLHTGRLLRYQPTPGGPARWNV